jgi:hypothetical protein
VPVALLYVDESNQRADLHQQLRARQFPNNRKRRDCLQARHCDGDLPRGRRLHGDDAHRSSRQKGYVPVATSNNSFACKDGDVRVERPPYQLNGALTYETCAAGPSCPAGYIETVDPDNALGTSKVCVLPCQSFVMNQSMACSCGSGARLAAQQPGAPVRQVCQATCPAGTHWEASSPLFAFQAEQGQCIADGGGVAVPLAESNVMSQRDLLERPGMARSAAVPTAHRCLCSAAARQRTERQPLRAGCHRASGLPGTTGTDCSAPNAPAPCPIFPRGRHEMRSDLPASLPGELLERQQMCAEVQFCPPPRNGSMDGASRSSSADRTVWDGTKCIPKMVFCVPPKKWVNGQCVAVPQQCGPNEYWNGTKHAEVPVLHSAKEMDQRKCVRRPRRPL